MRWGVRQGVRWRSVVGYEAGCEVAVCSGV